VDQTTYPRTEIVTINKWSRIVTIKMPFTSSNPVYHEITKHIEVSCHFVWEKLLFKEINTEFISSNDQVANVLAKSLRGLKWSSYVPSLVHTIQYVCSSLRGVLENVYSCLLEYFLVKLVFLCICQPYRVLGCGFLINLFIFQIAYFHINRSAESNLSNFIFLQNY